MFKKKWFVLLVFVFILKLPVLAQHFKVVYGGNAYTPMNIVVDSALLDSALLKKGDEIAAFDTTSTGAVICVGVVIIENDDSTGNVIIASADDPTTSLQDGFIVGHPVIFKYWDNSEGIEITLINSKFSDSYSDKYAANGTALVDLDGYSYLTWNGNVSNDWYEPGNWNFNKIPDTSFGVFIPVLPSGKFYPAITDTSARCRNLKIADGAELELKGKLNVNSD
jgi:hypothetical protein